MNLRMLVFVTFLSLVTVLHSMMLSTGQQDLVEYLVQYRYLQPNATDAQLQRAIRFFQQKFNLTVTGIFTQETRNFMNKSRCGFPDILPEEYSLYDIKWDKKDLTFKIESFTNQLTQDQQRTEFKRAFDEWERQTQLTFTEVSGTTEANFKINFYKKAHNDGSDFDGPSGVLAHAFYPRTGDIHFDDDEDWGVNVSSKTDLYGVMLHEIGHALGIEHSDDSSAVMYPMYRGYVKDLKLHQDDIAGIQELYGPKIPATDCAFDYDAVMTKGGQMYGFKGSKMVKIDKKGSATETEKDISDTYAGVTAVDEAIYHQPTDQVYLFKERKAYIFKGSTKVSEGYFMYPLRFAYSEGSLLKIFTDSNFKISFDASGSNVPSFEAYSSQSPLTSVNTATSSSSGTVYYYSNKKQYTLTNGLLTAFCPA